MDWMNVLAQVFEIVVFPLLGVGTVYLVFLIKAKINELKLKHNSDLAKKYFDMLDKTICDAVIATNQTYVEALKKEGKFDADAQKKAFEQTYNTVMKLLTADAKEYLETAVADLTVYINTRIEAEVNVSKKLNK